MTGQQLKNSILQLAIQGKLVPQDPNDEPASVLLSRIRKEKEQLVKDGKLKKKDLVTTPISDEEKPFEIPEGWEWCRLGEYCERITDYVASGSFASLKANVPILKEGGYAIMVKTADFSNNFSSNLTYTTEGGYKFLSNSNLFGGELIITNIGATLGKVSIVPYLNKKMTLAPNSVMIRLYNDEHRDFLKLFLSSPVGFQEMKDISSGTAMKKFNKTDLKTILFPLPPLAEQHRIVAKIEELMPLVDEYDKAQTELDALNTKLPEALKKSILQEAIMGKLGTNDPNDEPASELLHRIRKEKEQLVKDGKLKKKDLTTTPISDEEKPFEIPGNWEWVKVGNIFKTYSGGTPDKGHPEYYSSQDVMWAKVGDLKTKNLFETEEYISTAGMMNSSAKIFPTNTVLVAMYCNDAIGKSSIAKTELTSNQAICGIIPNRNVLPEYLYYAIQNFRDTLIEKSAGGAQKNINQIIIKELVFPLPPLAEQHRIVEKLEKILPKLKEI